MNNILWFSEISKDDIGKVGGKGANLGEMVSFDIPVPPGFVITAQAYFDFIKKNKIDKLIKKETEGLETENTSLLNQVSEKIKRAILAADISNGLIQEIQAAYLKLGERTYVAVRSSATAEDLPTASFAGQQATFLNVFGKDEVVKAVKKAWASLFEARSIYYRETNKFDHLKVGIAVPVQKMVQSEISGVAFSVDPVTNDEKKIAIEAAFGLGEVVVSGAVSPDRYIIDKETLEILEKKIAKQTWAIKKIEGINKRVKIDYEKQEEQKLSDELIVELGQFIKKIEKHYQTPQDIEWAVESGKIYFVQTRPITTLKSKTKDQKSKIEKGHRVILKGSAASVGAASGKVKIIKKVKEIEKIKKGDVLVAEMTNPSYVPAMKRASAIITDRGGQTSHAAIVSRELAIPCVVGTSEATKVLRNGQKVTVDGENGLVYEGNVVIRGEAVEKDYSKLPKTKTKIYVNLAEVEAAQRVAKMPVDGVGLLRAEFMIADIGEHPRAMIERGEGNKFIAKLAAEMEIFAKNFSPRPVIYRTTDFKSNEYQNLKGGKKYEKDEPNPMIGFRGAFRYLKEPEVFKLELRAIKKVRKNFKNLWLMIPFIRTVDEMSKIKKIVADEGLKRGENFKLLLMCEVPSTVILAEEFIKIGIDGFSIGSNDLTQLTLGLDRDNEVVAEEFDERNEAVVKSIKKVIQTCKKYGVTSSICGQAPSVYPEITEMLVKEGITSISVNPDVVVKTKKLVAKIESKLMN